MGQAKLKQRAAFAPALVDEWESEDCVKEILQNLPRCLVVVSRPWHAYRP